jgi:acyl-CoA synthetase (AMP-forming)/AMP-acid ligase II
MSGNVRPAHRARSSTVSRGGGDPQLRQHIREQRQRLRITAVPPAKEVNLSSLHSLIVAGSPLAPHRLAQAYDLIGDAVHQGYGQSETGMLSLLTAEDVRARRDTLASVGRPWTGVELEVRDDAGNPVPVGTTGEIWACTGNAFAAYRHDEHASAEVLQDGWVRIGDLGHLDDHGFLYLTERSRDVIIINAIIHYAGPIERANRASRHRPSLCRRRARRTNGRGGTRVRGRRQWARARSRRAASAGGEETRRSRRPSHDHRGRVGPNRTSGKPDKVALLAAIAPS